MQLPLREPQEHPQPRRWDNSSMIRASAGGGEIFQFGGFRLLLRRRQLLANGVPIELGTRAFDLLLVLLQADGSLVTKDELLHRVWRGIVVAEENLKVQISALRKALGEDRDFIHTEFGRGYRFIAPIRSIAAEGGCHRASRPAERSHRRGFAHLTCRRSLQG
jgi:DNA-binding winged helix-turn-helix (wHTH) protein